MFSTDFDFQKDLAAHHVFTAWRIDPLILDKNSRMLSLS